jgi:hypothetical protein
MIFKSIDYIQLELRAIQNLSDLIEIGRILTNNKMYFSLFMSKNLLYLLNN